MFGDAATAFGLIIWQPVLIGLISALVIASLLSFETSDPLASSTKDYGARWRQNIVPAIGYSVPVTLLAYMAGYLTGISRSPAIGNTIPAALALLGGLNLYIFGTEAKNRGFIAYSIVLFALVLLYSVQVGAIERESGREARLIALSEQERRIRFFRANRDLPPEPPQWLLGTEPK
jgi:hypothetical protein